MWYIPLRLPDKFCMHFSILPYRLHGIPIIILLDLITLRISREGKHFEELHYYDFIHLSVTSSYLASNTLFSTFSHTLKYCMFFKRKAKTLAVWMNSAGKQMTLVKNLRL
jgi:hypothetical protein